MNKRSLHPNNKVVAIEARYRKLNLKNLGGDDGDVYRLEFWKICGKEYIELYSKNSDDQKLIKDVLLFPHRNKIYSQTLGSCTINRKIIKNATISLVKYDRKATELLAIKVWMIDTKKFKFIELSPKGVFCSSVGIATSDLTYK